MANEINIAPVDRFTLAHGAIGLLAAAARIPLPWLAAGAVAWEVAERPLKEVLPKLFPRQTQDSFENASVDALAMVGGWLLWYSLFERPQQIDRQAVGRL